MLKLLGALLILTSCTALGIKKVTKNRKALKAIQELADAMTEMARAIQFNMDPLPSIIRRLKNELFSEENSFISRLSAQMDENPDASLPELWQKALSDFSHEHHLPQKAFSIASAIGENLGKMDYETEVNRLTTGHSALTELFKNISQSYEKTEKMTKSLGVILGIFIVILLL